MEWSWKGFSRYAKKKRTIANDLERGGRKMDMERMARACLQVVAAMALENTDCMGVSEGALRVVEDALVEYLLDIGRRAAELAEARDAVLGPGASRLPSGWDVARVLHEQLLLPLAALRSYAAAQEDVPFPRDIPDLPVAPDPAAALSAGANRWRNGALAAEALPPHIPAWLPRLPLAPPPAHPRGASPAARAAAAAARATMAPAEAELAMAAAAAELRSAAGAGAGEEAGDVPAAGGGDLKRLRSKQRHDVLDSLISLNQEIAQNSRMNGRNPFTVPASSAKVTQVDLRNPVVGDVFNMFRRGDILERERLEEDRRNLHRLTPRSDDRTPHGKDVNRARGILELTHNEGLRDLVMQPGGLSFATGGGGSGDF